MHDFLTQQATRAALLALVVTALPQPVLSQTDYYNTDRNRPIRIEDAYATERYSFDAHLAPLRLERGAGGVYNWGIDPEVAYGILPRTQLELGLPVAYLDRGSSGHRAGLTGIDLSLLYNLNAESSTFPALGVRASMLFPVGSLAPERTYSSVQGMLTRTHGWGRIHVNGEYTFGTQLGSDGSTAATATSGSVVELSRWLGGVAVDRTLPLRSMLVTAELYARHPFASSGPVDWNAGAGIRHQLSPLLAVDAGLGTRLSGSDRGWFATVGLARVFGIPFLMSRP